MKERKKKLSIFHGSLINWSEQQQQKKKRASCIVSTIVNEQAGAEVVN